MTNNSLSASAKLQHLNIGNNIKQITNSNKYDPIDSNYTMPDKSVVNVPATVRMGCPELLFDPARYGNTEKSMPGLAWSSISASDIDVRKELCKNVIMSGNSTMYEGIPDRLKSELVAKTPSSAKIRVVASADRKYAV